MTHKLNFGTQSAVIEAAWTVGESIPWRCLLAPFCWWYWCFYSLQRPMERLTNCIWRKLCDRQNNGFLGILLWVKHGNWKCGCIDPRYMLDTAPNLCYPIWSSKELDKTYSLHIIKQELDAEMLSSTGKAIFSSCKNQSSNPSLWCAHVSDCFTLLQAAGL